MWHAISLFVFDGMRGGGNGDVFGDDGTVFYVIGHQGGEIAVNRGREEFQSRATPHLIRVDKKS